MKEASTADGLMDNSCAAIQLETIAAESQRRARERLRELSAVCDGESADSEQIRRLRREACGYLSDAEDLARLAHRFRVRRPSLALAD